MLKRYLFLALVLSGSLFLAKSPGEDALTQDAAVAPEADRYLRQMSEYLAGSKQFTFEAYRMVDVVLESGQKIQLADSTNVSVVRPDRIRTRSTGDTLNDEAWYDKTTLSILDKDENTYAVIDVPDNIDEMLDYMAEKDNYLIGLAGKNKYPDVTLGVNYISTESRYDASPPDNGKDPLVASISINLPIWRKKYNSLERTAQAEYRSVLRSREEKENSLIADLEMAIYELRDAERKITLYRDTLLKKAEQNVSINQLAFASEKATFLDLIDAQRVLLEFQLAEKKALADYGKALAEIEMLTGDNLKGK